MCYQPINEGYEIMNAKGYFYTEESDDGIIIEAFEGVNEEIIEEMVDQIQFDLDSLQDTIRKLEDSLDGLQEDFDELQDSFDELDKEQG